MKYFKRKKAKKQSQAQLKQLIAEYDHKTSEITDEAAIAMLDMDKANVLLDLLKIADFVRKGKPRAILIAFKLGYLQGKSIHKLSEDEKQKQDIVSEAAVKLQKASTVLRTTIENYSLGNTNLTKEEIMIIGFNASNICDMILIASDYVYNALKELEAGVLE